MLEDGSQTLQAHAGVHTGRRQRRHRTSFVHVELHEHVVPNFDEAVAVFIGAPRGATRDVVTVIVKNFRTRAARASVGHHPKVVALIAPAFVVADADDPFGGQANFLCPDVVGLVVLLVNGSQQALFGQFVDLCQQLPSPFQALALEVVAKRPVTQHFEEGVMPRGVTHVFQVVVFATCAQTGLHRGSAHIRALVRAQKHIFELHHPRVGEHEGGVVARHQRAGSHHGVAFGGEEIEKTLPNVGDRCGG